jgi:GrpB-like predicted nucleotidyltransferase (UPF0157 family)
VKRALAGREWEDRNDYAAARTEIIEEIITRGGTSGAGD